MLHPLDFSTRPKPRKGCLSDSEQHSGEIRAVNPKTLIREILRHSGLTWACSSQAAMTDHVTCQVPEHRTPRSESKPYSSSHPNGGSDVRVVFWSVSLVALIDQARLYYVIQKTYTKRIELDACIYCPEWRPSRRRVRNTWHDVLATRFTVRSCPCHHRCHYRSPHLCHYHYPCPCPCPPHSLRCLDQC
jgi:hypothetical protein